VSRPAPSPVSGEGTEQTIVNGIGLLDQRFYRFRVE